MWASVWRHWPHEQTLRRLEVRYRPEAVDDLESIFFHVLGASFSVSIAAGFVERMRQRCERIGDAPHGGRPRDDLYPGLRTVPFERTAVIAYLVEDHCVRITNVFYGGQDYEALYRQDRE